MTKERHRYIAMIKIAVLLRTDIKLDAEQIRERATEVCGGQDAQCLHEMDDDDLIDLHEDVSLAVYPQATQPCMHVCRIPHTAVIGVGNKVWVNHIMQKPNVWKELPLIPTDYRVVDVAHSASTCALTADGTLWQHNRESNEWDAITGTPLPGTLRNPNFQVKIKDEPR